MFKITPLKSPVYWAFFIIMLDSLSFGLIMPVMPDLLMDSGCASVSDAALYGGLLSAAFAALQFVCAPLIGNLSDRFGRKPILLVSLGVLLVDYAVKGLAHSLWVLFAGRIICGIGLANLATAQAAIDDVSLPKDRAARFGLLACALGFGFIGGALFGGMLSSLGPRTPCYAAAFLALLNIAFAFCFMGETLSISKRRRFCLRRANPFGAFKSVTLEQCPMLLTIFFYEIAFVVYVATWSFFTKARFGWNSDMIGVSLGFFGIMAALMQGIVIRFFLARLGEFKTAAFALIISSLAFFLYAQASQPWMIFALIPLSAFGTLFSPAVQSLLSQSVNDDSFGELQGLVVSVRAVSLMIGPPLMTGIFHYFTADDTRLYFPGAVFIFATIISMLSLTVFLGAFNKKIAQKTQSRIF